MIVLKFRGGLGNQLFQYHAGKAFAQRIGTNVLFDVTEYNLPANDKYRPFLLKHFDFDISMIKEKKKAIRFLGGNNNKTVKLNRFSLIDGENITETTNRLTVYNENDIYLPENNQYINGYFCDEKYLSNVGLLRLFEEKNTENEKLLVEIKKTISVSVHMRRTDYLEDVHNYYQGICTDRYYSNAIKLIRMKMHEPNFFIFSDDPLFANSYFKERFNDLRFTVIDCNAKKDDSYRDLFLMANCKHNIVANSTFSWWGAFYNENPNKMIICPTRFRKNETKNIFPVTWERVES
jgi:hypothetical protein